MLRQILCLFCLLVASASAAERLNTTEAEFEARLKLAHQLAREQNDGKLVDRVQRAAAEVKRKLSAQDSVAADKLIREMETAVGLDPGGWSMAGQKIFHPTPGMLERAQAIRPKLTAALAADDEQQVRAVVAEWRAILGDQAGLPDARRKGERAEFKPFTEAQAVRWFLAALDQDRKPLREISAGRLVGDNMLRFYAGIISAVCDIRSTVARHEPKRLAELDGLVAGACRILTDRQQPSGLFPFPDLRGKNIRFGDLTDKLMAAGQGEIKDGWIVSADPSGGSQFDTGVCGVALLLAGQTYTNAAWTKAGQRAADWALTQKCCPNFNYNAFSVSLLARAFERTGEVKYLDGALRKLRVGVAPGQTENGRWLDAHNARTVYHQILFRALGDLLAALPAERKQDRGFVAALATRAATALLDENEAAGVTVVCLSELQRYATTLPGPWEALERLIKAHAAVVRAKCVRGSGARFGVSPTELAVLTRVK